MVKENGEVSFEPRSHPPGAVVQLREAHALGVVDHHQGRVGNVDADFDHGRRHEQLDAARLKSSITRAFSTGLSARERAPPRGRETST